MVRFLVGALVATALVTLARQANAQGFVEKRTAAGQNIAFDDDPMGAFSNEPIGAQIRSFLPPRRTLLMRERSTFVPEMLKTVEGL